MSENIGIRPENSTKVAQALSSIVADIHLLSVKTKNYHWNMKGPNFVPFHKLLDEHYTLLEENTDEVAERILMIGHKAPGTLKEFLKLSTIKEHDEIPSENEMMKNLAGDHELMCRNLRKAINICQEEGDEGSADVLIKVIQFHEKSAWMLNAWKK